MTISGISLKDGKKVAYVRFVEGEMYAEGIIPECKISKHAGFNDEEILVLENYMRENIGMLKRRAAEINPLKAMFEEK